MTKEYKSELGKLYQSKREEAPLNKIVFDIYKMFEYYIEVGETLPIQISAKEYKTLTSRQILWVVDQLKQRGCVVEYAIEKRPNGDNNFVLTDLV